MQNYSKENLKNELLKHFVITEKENYINYFTEEEKAIYNAKIELPKIKKWFVDNDWKANKIITGEWLKSDERWLSYLRERKTKREEQDNLLLIIGKDDNEYVNLVFKFFN